MFITKKYHDQVIEHKDKSINDTQARVFKLEQELKEARDLKSLLEKLTDKTNKYYVGVDFATGMDYSTIFKHMPDDIVRIVDDALGGKVMKHEATTKCLIIDKSGNVKTGMTKHKADKGYSYKLVRE